MCLCVCKTHTSIKRYVQTRKLQAPPHQNIRRHLINCMLLCTCANLQSTYTYSSHSCADTHIHTERRVPCALERQRQRRRRQRQIQRYAFFGIRTRYGVSYLRPYTYRYAIIVYIRSHGSVLIHTYIHTQTADSIVHVPLKRHTLTTFAEYGVTGFTKMAFHTH